MSIVLHRAESFELSALFLGFMAVLAFNGWWISSDIYWLVISFSGIMLFCHIVDAINRPVCSLLLVLRVWWLILESRVG